MAKKKTFLILDGNALLHRAWHAIPPLTDSKGKVVNAVYGFTNVIEKMRADFQPDYMAVAWDLPGATFRHDEFEAYKGTRVKKEQELYDQIEDIQTFLAAYGVPCLSATGMEADDVIGTLAKVYGPKADTKVQILTGDLDALQLVDKDVEVVAFVKGLSETKVYDEQAVRERYGLAPDQLIDFKALMGDPSDNIPGIAGIGKKTAADLLQTYGSIEGIYEALKKGELPEKYAKKFKGQDAHVKQMKRLVTIVQDVDLDFSIEDARVKEPDIEKLKELFRAYGFRRLLQRYEAGGKTSEKKKPSKKISTNAEIPLVKATKLGKHVAVFINNGVEDLFSRGSIREIVLFDGTQAALFEAPDAEAQKNVLEALHRASLVIGHDVKAVMHQLHTKITAPLFDTMVGAYLLSPGTRNFDLSTVAYEFLKRTLGEGTDSVTRAKAIFDLADHLKKGLKKEQMETLAENIEMPLIPVLFEMERTGILLDEVHLRKLSVQFERELEILTKRIHKLCGKEFNINSPSQLAEVLFDELKLPTKGIKKTKSGYSTAASELEKLWGEHEIVALISRYREFAKLKSTYVDALPKLVAEDGRVHTSYNQTVAATGRLSSSDPNLQNIPIRREFGNEIRKAFIAPEGYKLLAADYSQFELRLAASMAKDASFIRAFKEGADIHARTAAEVLGKDEETLSKTERSAAKAINFAILYGMGPRNLARATGFSQTEAKAFLERYFEMHPGIRDYIDAMKIMAHEKGYVETLFGRRRYLPDINSGVQMLVAAAERMAVNMPVQGTQADLIKMAMLQVQKWIEKEQKPVRMLLQVHDELVFEIEESALEDVVPEIVRIMEGVWQDEVPLVVNAEIGRSWGELKKYE